MNTSNSKQAVPSFRVPSDLKSKLDAEIDKSGLSKTDYMTQLVTNSLKDDNEPEPDLIETEELPERQSFEGFAAIESMAESLDLIASKIGGQKSDIKREAVIEEIEEEFLLLKLTPEQKKVFTDILLYRNSKGHVYSSSAEELFSFMLQETFSGFNYKHPEFSSDFEQAFPDYDV